MEKALNVMYALREAVSLSKNYPSDEILDEAIAELEAMEQRTCEGCKKRGDCEIVENAYNFPELTYSNFCCNKWEAEDNA